MKTSNIYKQKKQLTPADKELSDKIIEKSGVTIERILSAGQVTPNGEWFNQERDEWVILLQGNAEIEFEGEGIIQVQTGDHLNIPPHKKHRVTFTSAVPPCTWLAVHY